MQIHELDNYTGSIDSNAFLAIDDGTDTGKISGVDFLAGVNEEINQVEEDLNNRIDNIIAGGSAPSEAEIIDARLGATSLGSTPYNSLGAAIRGQADQLDSYINMIGYGAEYEPGMSFSNGQIYASDGTIGTANTYKHSQLIPVVPGMKYSVTGQASQSFLMLAMYSTPSGNADTSKSIAGVDAITTKTGEIPSGIYYVRVGCATAAIANVVFKLSADNALDNADRIENNEIEFGKAYAPALTWNAAYIKASDGSMAATTAISCTDMIEVVPGQIVRFTSFGSSSVLLMACYEQSTDATAQVVKSVRGNDSMALITKECIIPKGINYIRFVCYNAYLSSFVASIQNQTYEHYIEKIYKNELEKIRNPYIYARRPVIGFILDKDFEHNEEMHDVFVEHNAPFGVAISYAEDTFKNVSLPVYLYWQEYEAFEMLTHGSYAFPTTDIYTDDQVRGFVNASYDTLIRYGVDPKGYIAGAGLMADRYIPFVQNKYNWAATRANHYSTDESCIFFGTDNPYKLWRYSMQTSTLAQMKAAVDRAISECALLLFYGHAQLNHLQNFTPENLDELLTYIETKEAVIKKPTDAVESFFAIRYDDLYQ